MCKHFPYVNNFAILPKVSPQPTFLSSATANNFFLRGGQILIAGMRCEERYVKMLKVKVCFNFQSGTAFLRN